MVDNVPLSHPKFLVAVTGTRYVQQKLRSNYSHEEFGLGRASLMAVEGEAGRRVGSDPRRRLCGRHADRVDRQASPYAHLRMT